MLTFKEFLAERTIIQSPTLGIWRKDMPQIQQSDLPDFLNYVKSRGYDYEELNSDPASLRSTQIDIDDQKIDSYADKDQAFYDELASKPIITAQGGHIVDGTHRTLGLAKHSPQTQIKDYRINTNLSNAIALAKTYPKQFSRTT